MTTATVEVWVVVDEDGDYAVGTGDDHAAERYREEIGDCEAGTRGMRRVKVLLTVPLPAPIKLAVTAPADDAAALVAAS